MAKPSGHTRMCARCGMPVLSRKPTARFCSKACWYATKKDTRPSLETRFWSRVAVCEHGRDCPYCCWPWTGAQQERGYGHLWGDERPLIAHRVAYELGHARLIPARMHACHHCDIPACCNWNHLFLGTQLANVQDKIRKRRHKYGENHHSTKLTPAMLDAIRLLLQQGVSLRAIGAQFGVSKSAVFAIKSGKSHKE